MTQNVAGRSPDSGSLLLDVDSVCRSPRMLSAFGSEVLRIDVSRELDGSACWEKDLCGVSLSLWGSQANVQSTVPLLTLRFAAHWAYIAVAAELERKSVATRLSHAVSSAFNAYHRFCVWMARRGITDLSAITRKDTDALLEALRLHSAWGPLLGESDAYAALAQRIATSKEPSSLIQDFASIRVRAFSFSEERLADILGFPVHNGQIPQTFTSAVAMVLKLPRNGSSVVKSEVGFAKRTFRGILTSINDLARVGDGKDGRFGLSFVPYSSPYRLAMKLTERQPTSFENLAIEDAVALLKECRRWVDDYADGIIQFYIEIGERLAELKSSHESNLSYQLGKHIRTASPRFEASHGLPPVSFSWKKRGARCVGDLVRTLQAACAIIVLVNHGRRHNEVIGEQTLPYGLYEGCLVARNFGDVVHYEMRVYIEKTVRDWALMSANAGVARAIGVLERLLEAGRKVSMALGALDRPLRLTGEGHAKLFQAVPLALGKANQLPSMFVWHDHSRWLFELAGVDPGRCAGQAHPFRRLFAQVYYYRYENADIRALSQWLFHATIGSTLTYVTDPSSRANAERIEARHRQSNNAMAAEIRAFGKEYLHDCLARLIDGSPSGGGFTTLVLRVFKAMSSRANFPSDTPARARLLTDWFTERGYAPEPHPHAACLAGTNSLSKARSKCYDPVSKRLRKDEASASKCSGCPHAFVNDGYMASDQEEVGRLEAKATDKSLPAPVRAAAKQAADHLRTTIEIETRLLGASRAKLAAIYDKIAAELETQHA